MINNRMNEGVGKKIVEALKKQNDVEITPVTENEPLEDYFQNENFPEDLTGNSLENEVSDMNFEDSETFVEEKTFEQASTPKTSPQQKFTVPVFEDTIPTLNFVQQQNNLNQASSINSATNFTKDLNDFELPSNITVLKQLILQLPTGVTKQTGALIIRQTMEALGISMKSVLQEAQQVQESINSSSRECQANIMEYKRQIVLLENQVQKYAKQYTALNDIISLFIQTGN